MGDNQEEYACERCAAPVARASFDPTTRLGECKACGLVIELMAMPRMAKKRVEASLANVARQARPITSERSRVELPEKVELEVDAAPVTLPPDAIARDAPLMPYREAAHALTEDGSLKRVGRAEARVVLRVKEGPRRAERDIMSVGFLAATLLLTDCACNAAAKDRPLTEHQASVQVAIEYLLLPIAIVAFAWLLTALIVNTRTIRLENGVLRITYGPIWRGGNITIHAEDIEQIWTRRTIEMVSGSKRSPEPLVAYNLEARIAARGNRKAESIVLVRSLNDRNQGLFIEQTLEHALGIVDVAVSDEDVTNPYVR